MKTRNRREINSNNEKNELVYLQNDLYLIISVIFIFFVYRICSYQSIDTNFSSLELLVAEILSILLVYSLHLSMFFSYI